MKSQDLAASSQFLVIPGSDSGTNSEKEVCPSLHLKSNDLFSSSCNIFFFSLSKKAKLGCIEMGPGLASGVGQSHFLPMVHLEIKSWNIIIGFAQAELRSLNTKPDKHEPHIFQHYSKKKTLVTICIPCNPRVRHWWHFRLLGAGDGHTAKQGYLHMQQAQTQQLADSRGCAGVPRRHAQGIARFTSEKLPLLSAAGTHSAGSAPSTDLLAATSAWTAT